MADEESIMKFHFSSLSCPLSPPKKSAKAPSLLRNAGNGKAFCQKFIRQLSSWCVFLDWQLLFTKVFRGYLRTVLTELFEFLP